MGDDDLCIDYIQHTEVEDIVEDMGAFGEDGALLTTAMMQMQPFRNYLLERTAWWSSVLFLHEVMVVCNWKN